MAINEKLLRQAVEAATTADLNRARAVIEHPHAPKIAALTGQALRRITDRQGLTEEEIVAKGKEDLDKAGCLEKEVAEETGACAGEFVANNYYYTGAEKNP